MLSIFLSYPRLCAKNRKYFSSMSNPLTFPKREEVPELDKTNQFAPKFDADGLIAAVAIDHKTREPLMLAYMNEESLKMTLEKQEAIYYSRSRQEIWHKGATSGHTQKIKEIRTDCDQDALILIVEQLGAGACHTGKTSCFYRTVEVKEGQVLAIMNETEETFDPEEVYGKSQ